MSADASVETSKGTAVETASETVLSAAKEIERDHRYVDPVKDGEKKVQHGPGAAPLPREARIKGQNYAVIALVESRSGHRGRVPLQIRGAYATVDEANDYIRDVLYRADPDHDHFVVPMWEWGIVPPTQRERQAMDMEYHNPEVQRHMDQYFKQREADRASLKARKKRAKQVATNKRNPDNKAAREEVRRETRRQHAKAIWKETSDPADPRVDSEKSSKEEDKGVYSSVQVEEIID